MSKEGFKKRTPKKCTSMAECKNRNEQFEKISAMRSMCEENHIPVFSIDTKKKEKVGPFRRGGQVYCDRSPRCKDHDLPSFASGKIIPYGIYDVQKACELAAEARTKSGLCVFINIKRKKYDTSRCVDSNYDDVCQRHITFDKELLNGTTRFHGEIKKQVNF